MAAMHSRVCPCRALSKLVMSEFNARRGERAVYISHVGALNDTFLHSLLEIICFFRYFESKGRHVYCLVLCATQQGGGSVTSANRKREKHAKRN
jgi:hypothetical protein